MYIKNNLFLPYQFATGQTLHDRVLYFSFINRDYDKNQSRCSILCLNLDTTETRIIHSPFHFDTKKHIKFELHAYEEDALIMSTGTRSSYDIQYNFFRYDFRDWHQLGPQPIRKKGFTFQEITSRKRVKTDSCLELKNYLVCGGSIVSYGTPTKFAVDNTHAFAYDNGPESPESKEYILGKEAKAMEVPAVRRLSLHEYLKSNKLPNCIPNEHLFRKPEHEFEISVFETKSDLLFKYSSYKEESVVELMHISKTGAAG